MEERTKEKVKKINDEIGKLETLWQKSKFASEKEYQSELSEILSYIEKI